MRYKMAPGPNRESWKMRATAKHLNFPLVVGMALAMTVASASATHLTQPRKPERPQQPATIQQEPVKRQNFRARRADEFPPWEGFEDCPMAFPCVGIVAPHQWQN